MRAQNILLLTLLSTLIGSAVSCGGGESPEVDQAVVAPDPVPEAGLSVVCVDNDADGFTVEVSLDFSDNDLPPSNAVSCSWVDDCDDGDDSVFPGAIETVGNGIDENCDLSDSAAAGDSDADGVNDSADNCPYESNVSQVNSDGDDYGDACDALPEDSGEWLDGDGDGIGNNADLCPALSLNVDTDSDGDGHGDACDAFPENAGESFDSDGDGFGDNADICPWAADADQADTDGDGIGNACDPDDDGDGILDGADNCALTPNSQQNDDDADDIGNNCDGTDSDHDGIANDFDNCITVANVGQDDFDEDGLGDACESDESEEEGGIDPDIVDEGGEEGVTAPVSEICGDGIDNDGDDDTDCEDSTCGSLETSCPNSDPDGDGLANSIDPKNSTANSWGYIDIDTDPAICIAEDPDYTYDYVEGMKLFTGGVFGSTPTGSVNVSGIVDETQADLDTFACGGFSAVGMDYGIYVLSSNLVKKEIGVYTGIYVNDDDEDDGGNTGGGGGDDTPGDDPLPPFDFPELEYDERDTADDGNVGGGFDAGAGQIQDMGF